jgi:DNA-binding CsgD family transcriptional regulator
MSFGEWVQKFLSRPRKRSNRKTKSFAQSITAVAPIKQRKLQLPEHMPVLTPREKEIVRLIRLGYSNKEVAGELGISVSTVKWNITNILGKFGVESSKQLIVLLSALGADELRYWLIE